VARVFLSHADVDLTLAREVHGWLVEAGHEVFLDRDPQDGIAVGERWEQQLYERLRWADAVVCVITSAYLASPWCTAEVGAAQARGSRLLPLRVEPGVVHPLLTSTQYTDYLAHPAPGAPGAPGRGPGRAGRSAAAGRPRLAAGPFPVPGAAPVRG